MSEMMRFYIGGLLKHAPALLAFAAPTTNSYRRLVPGYEAPINLVYSQRNRSACCRIPMYSPSPAAKRVEFRCPDPSANGYEGVQVDYLVVTLRQQQTHEVGADETRPTGDQDGAHGRSSCR